MIFPYSATPFMQLYGWTRAMVKQSSTLQALESLLRPKTPKTGDLGIHGHSNQGPGWCRNSWAQASKSWGSSPISHARSRQKFFTMETYGLCWFTQGRTVKIDPSNTAFGSEPWSHGAKSSQILGGCLMWLLSRTISFSANCCTERRRLLVTAITLEVGQ